MYIKIFKIHTGSNSCFDFKNQDGIGYLMHVEVIVLQIKKKSHMTQVWELHKICYFIYWLIAFTLKNIATAKAYFCVPFPNFTIYMNGS